MVPVKVFKISKVFSKDPSDDHDDRDGEREVCDIEIKADRTNAVHTPRLQRRRHGDGFACLAVKIPDFTPTVSVHL